MDFRLAHPVVGIASKSAPLGKVKPNAVVAEAREKRSKHAQAYEVAKLRFIPLVPVRTGR